MRCVEVNSHIGVRSKSYLRALCKGTPVIVKSSIAMKRGIALRNYRVGDKTLVNVNSAVLSRTVMKGKTVMTTNTLMLGGAIVKSNRL